MASEWVCMPRLYDVTKNYFPSFQTFDHPLKLSTVVDSKGTRAPSLGSNASSRSSSMSVLVEPLTQSFDGTDPLSQFAKQEQDAIDPLTSMASEYESFKKVKSKIRDKESVDIVDETLNWNSRRLTILNRFTTSEKLSISTSFLTAPAQSHLGTDTIKVQTVVSDKVKFRLEQLDDFEDGSVRHMMDLTQQEYIQRIEQLNQELVQSWHNDQRVKALKIAIQCSKILADTSVLSFYPSQFVLVTDILDIFGKLVYDRLKQKSTSGPESMRQANMDSARDTCQNWFFKIASIRELLPRLYVEMAILKCYEFLNENYENALVRLTKAIRGVGDPLVAVYARCYLIRTGVSVLAPNKTYIYQNFKDFVTIYQTTFSGAIRSELNRQRVDMIVYLSLYGPALNFILEALVHKNNLYNEEILKDVQNVKNNGTILMAILHAFQPEFIAAHAFEFVNVLSLSNTEGISKSQLFKALGSSMSTSSSLCESKQAFLQEVFKTINTFTDPREYIMSVESWAQFIATNMSINEVNRFLGEIHSRVSTSKTVCEKHHQQLRNILDKIVQHQKDIEQLLVQEYFLVYLDLFQKESLKVEACKYILDIYKRNGNDHTNDPVVINALMYIGKILNDYVNALTVEDEKRQISQLICHFIRKVYFENDFEKQLSFYVEARGTFSNLDAVYNTLVHSVNKLAMETCQIVQYKHTRKTLGFVKACVAFCFITIPSISSVQQQMDLYLLSGQVALVNNCLGQADSCFEEALNLVPELNKSLEMEGKSRTMDNYLVSFLNNMLATLVLVPDSPEQGVLYLLRLLLDVMQNYEFVMDSLPAVVYLNALDMLYVQSLDAFPYHIPGVVSNDELYGHDPKFLGEVNNLCSFVVEEILRRLSQLGSAQQYKLQATLSLELLLRIVRYADLAKDQIFLLAVNLGLLAMKHEAYLEPKYIPRILRTLEDSHKIMQDSKSPQASYIQQLLVRLNYK
ncbi:VPS35 endosomal protein sorting factor-like [Stomoxys calcitrans]|uniref:VPS35 endosomal protein sorting factor-like n=1 Tax=Stomoxys calcitrans TaxID=35570 RepID=UPI0027E2DB9D|nr:VPS35 endosomal protein sorting factor-like [Stomoxys calcitrans]